MLDERVVRRVHVMQKRIGLEWGVAETQVGGPEANFDNTDCQQQRKDEGDDAITNHVRRTDDG